MLNLNDLDLHDLTEPDVEDEIPEPVPDPTISVEETDEKYGRFILNKPIFIFGSPRSGVTLLENILGIHPELAWLSQYNNQHPKRAEVSIINQLFNIPVIGPTIYGSAWKKKIIIVR